jgi:hypothetical protein
LIFKVNSKTALRPFATLCDPLRRFTPFAPLCASRARDKAPEPKNLLDGRQKKTKKPQKKPLSP